MIPDSNLENTLVQRYDNLIFREIGGEVIIITGDGLQMHMLNETASLIWNCAGQRASFAEIVARVCDEYEVDEEMATRDVLTTIESMREKNLVKWDTDDANQTDRDA